MSETPSRNSKISEKLKEDMSSIQHSLFKEEDSLVQDEDDDLIEALKNNEKIQKLEDEDEDQNLPENLKYVQALKKYFGYSSFRK